MLRAAGGCGCGGRCQLTRSHTGKTSLRNRYFRGSKGFTQAYIASIGADFTTKTIELDDSDAGGAGNKTRISLQLWDTGELGMQHNCSQGILTKGVHLVAGQERFQVGVPRSALADHLRRLHV